MWFKKTESEEKTGFAEKDFKLTPDVEMKLIPFYEITDKMQSRMVYLRNSDKNIKNLRKAIDKADESIAKLKDAVAQGESLDINLLNELTDKNAQAVSDEQVLMMYDQELQELDRKSREIMYDPKFYKPILRLCYKIREKTLDNLSVEQIDKMVAFFLTNIMQRKKSYKTNLTI